MKYYTILFCFLSYVAHGEELFPYLQNITPNSVIMNWKTNSDDETTVFYGSSESGLDVTVTGTTNIFTDLGYMTEQCKYYYHTAKITNLKSNTKYYYRIKTGKNESAVYSFKTLPPPGEAATTDGKIRFLIMGDNQIKQEPRYERLVLNAYNKLKEKYGDDTNPCDNIALTFMVGDQVDTGTLDHYEFVHFKKNIKLSPYLSIQTTVGNHETYGTLKMNAYYDHFYIDELKYKDITSGNENYYAMQAGNVLFISLSSEHTGDNQRDWLQEIITAANKDKTVHWIISLSHRPYQAEQYVGDISSWVRETAVPLLTTSEKYLMHIGAHHHLYHRGQLKNTPTYQIISGGTAWDQYWGMSTEKDFDDVQKTLTDWTYQIVEVDVKNEKVDVESYSIGGVDTTKVNALIDTFHRYRNQSKPATPSITNNFSTAVTLPLTIEGSAFSSPSGELLNTTQFQFSKAEDFSVIAKEFYRDFEDWFGSDGKRYKTKNQNKDVDILKATIKTDALSNGKYFVKVRYRDRNLEWSQWSPVKQFEVTGSSIAGAVTGIEASEYLQNSPIKVTYSNGPGNLTDWIGIYKKGDTPGGPSAPLLKQYLNGKVAGSITFKGVSDPGLCFVGFFKKSSYTEIAPRVNFYVGTKVELKVKSEDNPVGEPINISFTGVPNLPNAWIGIYKMGLTPGKNPAAAKQSVKTASGELNFKDLPKGYYFAQYFLQEDNVAVGQKVFFKLGDLVTTVWSNKPTYILGENIVASWTDSPGIVKDWLGIYPTSVPTPNDKFISYTYFDGVTEGSKALEGSALPKSAGDYYLVMFTNDSYTEVSNRVQFEVLPPPTTTTGITPAIDTQKNLEMYPNPTKSGQPTFIRSEYPIEKIELLSVSGALLYETNNVQNKQYSLINESLPSGTYLVKIYSRKLFTLKLIIQ